MNSESSPNKISGEPHACLFCNRKGDMSKQHIFPDWMGNVAPRFFKGREEHRKGFFLDGPTNQFKFYKDPYKKQQGHMGTQKLRKVCRTCNSGWISVIENSSKEIISALIKSKSTTITSKNQELVARWAVMATMVADAREEFTQAVTKSDRNYMFKNRQVPTKWRVYIGRTSNLPIEYRYNSRRLIYDLVNLSSGGGEEHHAKLTIFSVGHFLVLTVLLPFYPKEITFGHGFENKLVQISPEKHKNIDWLSLNTLNSAEIDEIFNYINHYYLGGPVY